jgi:hypothetical protein
VTSTEDASKGEVATALESTSLVTALELEVLGLGGVEILLSRPFESFGPSLVSEPVANVISITSIDQDWNLLKNAWDQSVEGLHPVTLEKEVSVDVKVTAVIAADFNAELLLHFRLVQELTDPSKSRIAQVAAVFALATDIVNVLGEVSKGKYHKVESLKYLSSSLIWSNHGIVAVNACRNARPNTLAVVAVLDQTLATWKCVVHSLTFAGIEDSWVSTLSASHWSVVLILGKTIGQSVTDKDRLEVDVALLVGQDFGGEDGNIVTGIRFTSDMEILCRILRELFEEQSEKSINILASSNGVAD